MWELSDKNKEKFELNFRAMEDAKKEGKKYGKTAAEGIKEGIKEEVKKSNEEIKKEVEKIIPNGISSNSKSTVKAFKTLLKTLDYERKMDIISEDEYYTSLEELRDRYFVKGSDKWLYYTEKIYTYQKKFLESEKNRYEKTYDDIFEYASDKIDAVIKKQGEYEEKLRSYGGIFKRNIIRLDEGDMEFYSLGDLKSQNIQIERYINLMQEAKRYILDSGMSENSALSLLDEISQLPVHSASTALEKITKSPLSKDWLVEYEKKAALSDRASKEYYLEDFAKAVDDGTEYMKLKLSEAGFDIPETFFDAGIDSAKRFGEGFSAELNEEFEKIKSQIAEFTSIVEINIPQNPGEGNKREGDRISNTNYYISQNPQEDITSTIKRYEAIKRLSGY